MTIVWDEQPLPGGKHDPIPEIEERPKIEEKPVFVPPQTGTISYTNFMSLDNTAQIAFLARGGMIAGV